MRTLGIVLCVLSCPTGAASDRGAVDLRARIARVIDGDSLQLETRSGQRLELRLASIDAPELDQAGGAAAKASLERYQGDTLRPIRLSGRDRYGRLLGCPSVRGRDLCLAQVAAGHAWVYRAHSNDQALLAAESAARSKRLGLWQQTNPVAPWDWRQQLRVATNPRDCHIKGNINSRGERIYHRPGDQAYDRTRIATGRGERWFCSAAEAEAAGWRAARR